MTNTYKVGDKVEHADYGTVELVYGPADFASTSGMWVGRKFDGDHALMTTTAIRPIFAVGDMVKNGMGTVGKLVAGPYVSAHLDGVFWVLERADNGKHLTPLEQALTKVAPADEPIKVGDRVRVLVDQANSASVKAGDVFTVKRMDEDGGVTTDRHTGTYQWYFTLTNVERVDEPPANTYTHDGVTYDLAARYRDREGDTFEFSTVQRSTAATEDGNADGTPLGRMPGGYWVWSLAETARKYGPLTRVND